MIQPNKPQVFLSYSHDDLETVRQLYEDLIKRSVNVWFDKESIAPGRWKTQIRKAIPKSRYFLFCISGSALRKTNDGSGFIDDELQDAYEIAMAQGERQFTMVPVRLEECGQGDHRLSMFQQYDLFKDWEGIVDKLAVYLGGRALTTTVIKEERTKDEELSDSIFKKAVTLFYTQKYAEVLHYIDTAYDLNDKRHEMLMLKGISLHQLSRTNESIEVYQKALAAYQADPDNPYDQIKKEFAPYLLGVYEEALELDSSNALAWAGKGNALAMLERDDDAIKALEEAVRLKPKDIHTWIQIGSTLKEQGSYAKAIDAFDEALKIEPSNYSTLVIKGGIHYQLGNYREVIIIAEKLRSLKPGDPIVYMLKGSALLVIGRHDEAVIAVDEALKLDPHNPEIWELKAGVLFAAGRLQDASMVIENANKLRNDASKTKASGKNHHLIEDLLSKANAKLSTGENDNAMSLFEEILSLNPDHAEAWYGKGAVLFELKRYEESLENILKSIKLNPQFDHAWYIAGISMFALGANKEALNAFDTVIRLNSNYAHAWHVKACILEKDGHFEEALEAIGEALKINPKFTLAWSIKGAILEKLGRTDEANAAHTKANELSIT